MTTKHAFRVEWTAAVDQAFARDVVAALSSKAPSVLRAAGFVRTESRHGNDAEGRVWAGPVCISVTWEPGEARFGFYVLDETLRERLGCIVFAGVACTDAKGAAAETSRVLDVLRAEAAKTSATLRVTFEDAPHSIPP